MDIAAPKFEAYNSGLALELCALTFGLVALFILMRKLVMHSDKRDGAFGTGWGCVSVGATGLIALQYGMQWGLLTGLLCLIIGAAYAGFMLGAYARWRDVESDKKERERARRSLERFNAERVAANNVKRKANEQNRQAGLKKIGGQ